MRRRRRRFGDWLRWRAATTDRLCRLVLLDILPAIAERDLERFFGESVRVRRGGWRLLRGGGRGGRYAIHRCGRWWTGCGARAFVGLVRTSWGPTIFAVCRDAMAADELRREIATEGEWSGCRVTVGGAMNLGAGVEPVETEGKEVEGTEGNEGNEGVGIWGDRFQWLLIVVTSCQRLCCFPG